MTITGHVEQGVFRASVYDDDPARSAANFRYLEFEGEPREFAQLVFDVEDGTEVLEVPRWPFESFGVDLAG